jgi:molybdopterin-guanine dinucleotide biosynthesis protein A
MNFSAVILAGGKSSRMGRDKAFLEISGQTLLARQIQTVRAAGATEIFISGRANADYSAFGCLVLKDNFPDAGPLAGIEAALAAATHPLLLVLAVDMPRVNVEFLRRLAADCLADCGIIPKSQNGIEPLAAFYPKSAQSLAETLLRADDNGAANFAKQCVQSGLARFVDLSANDAQHFTNWNSSADLPCTT